MTVTFSFGSDIFPRLIFTYMDNPKVALVARKGLGDGLINFVIAYNLSINNYDVTLYNNFMSELSEWLSGIPVKPWPLPENC